MSNSNAKYELWKNKLLDIGRRNRLVNYRDTKSSTIRFLEPKCDKIYNLFVEKECPIEFPMPPEEGLRRNLFRESDEIENSDVLDPEDSEEEWEYKTDKKGKERQRVLRNLRNKAKTAIEEQGINMLYLSFGFLHYSEAAHSGIEMLAPLILVPVSLTIDSITSPFVLSLHEDEITVNPTLSYKLETEYGLLLPPFDEEQGIGNYLKEIERLVEPQKWSVEWSTCLSLMAFLKINMYEDLKKHEEKVLSNPIVKALMGDSTSLVHIPEGLSTYDFDKNDNPKEVFQVVDADSSQQEAILYANKGISFVLQGPPGTGKSQTITNIIAECLARGKKILFVSEKKAALDVVYRRLQAVGLSDFCLVLHSHKTNKRAVLDQLDQVMSLANKKATVSDEAMRRLTNLEHDRDELNQYVNQLHVRIEPLKKSIYEANGIIANLQDVKDLIFKIPNVKDISRSEMDELIYTLSRYNAVVGKMTSSVAENPWYNSTVPFLTNELRHDIGANCTNLLRELDSANKTIPVIYGELRLAFDNNYESISRAIDLLGSVEGAYEIPVTWVNSNLGDVINSERISSNNRHNQIKELATLYSKTEEELVPSQFAEQLRKDSFTCKNEAIELKKQLQEIINTDPIFSKWDKVSEEDVAALIDEAEAAANDIHEYIDEIGQEYEKEIFDVDYKAIRARIKTEYSSIFRVFKGQYKSDRQTITANRKALGKLASFDEMCNIVETLYSLDAVREWFTENTDPINNLVGADVLTEDANYDELRTKFHNSSIIHKMLDQLSTLIDLFQIEEDKSDYLQSLFGKYYLGINTDWDLVDKAMGWARTFKLKVNTFNPPADFVSRVCSDHSFWDLCEREKTVLEKYGTTILPLINWYSEMFDSSMSFSTMPFTTLFEHVQKCNDNIAKLEEWIDYRTIRDECSKTALRDYIPVIEEENIPTEKVIPAFRKRFYRLWLDAVLPDYPAVQRFRRKIQDQLVGEFATLDKTQFEIARARIKGRLINGLPQMDHFTSGLDEISILKRELKKQRKIMPIRKLFAAIPNLLLTLKPCLMMSPLSVSLYLESDSYLFDTVIFDEASQVFPENAIGAISRAKQVIIAGDSKQLPPTSFFQTTALEGDYDSDDDDSTEVYESILDEANMLPERTLNWHYRSRNEELIAYSNAKIYKNRLITFPSSTESSTTEGVQYIYVKEGFYDRGGRKGNVIEAQKVVQLIFDHFEKEPNRSLGVIAFGEVQQQAIETELTKVRLQKPQFESFFSEEKEEPFFIKSLENVQGDERDTIIFSIGYAKDSKGVFRNQFGPLSSAGGERRLNVAITRAKYNIKLVGSILPTDINTDRISTEGPKLLRGYIDYAMHGPSVLSLQIEDTDIIEHESPFEEAVYNFLDRKGYKLATQVGCSGYRIDMAVKHPTLNGVFVLGIECDGAAYHSAITARERDRLRQEVLENMGWKIYRIWSTDWIKDPVTEGKLLEQAVNAAITTYDKKMAEQLVGQKSTANQLPNDTKATTDDTQYVSLSDKPSTENDPIGHYGFERAKSYLMPRAYVPLEGYRPDDYVDMTDGILTVVTNEYPIHYELLCQKLAYLAGNDKATSKVRRWVNYGLSRLQNEIAIKGEFLYPATYSQIIPRLPNERNIQHISEDELMAAMMIILKQCYGANREALINETARVYGFARSGQNIYNAMNYAINSLIKEKKIAESDGKLTIIA